MADRIVDYINNIPANPHRAWQDDYIQLNFDRDNNEIAELSLSNMEFVRENSTLINNYIGNYGPFIGVPFRREVNGDTITSGHLVMSDNPQVSAMRSTISYQEFKGIDWLNDVAKGFDFNYLYRVTKDITDVDFKRIPYVINRPVDFAAIATAQLTAFVVITEIFAAVEKIQELSVEASNPFEVTAIIRLALYVIYLGLLVASLVKLIRDIYRLLVQPVKYHAGMTCKRHFEVACKHLKLNFQTTILTGQFENLCLMPKKFQPTSDSTGTFGTKKATDPMEGFFKGTFYDFIQALKTMFAAKVVIVNDTLYFVGQHEMIGAPKYTIPPIDIYDLQVGYNVSDMKANTYISFTTDSSDNNTLIEYQGTSYQVIVEHKSLPGTFISTLRELEEIQIPFSLARRKNSLSFIENIFSIFVRAAIAILSVLQAIINIFISILNFLIRAVNTVAQALQLIGINLNYNIPSIRPVNFVRLISPIEDRLGMMLLENDYFENDKIFLITEGNKLPLNNHILVSAKYIYTNYIAVSMSFVPSAARPAGNQYKVYPLITVNNFKKTDYDNVKNNKFVKLSNGKTAEILSLKYYAWHQKAEIEYRVNEIYDNNLIERYYEPTGR